MWLPFRKKPPVVLKSKINDTVSVGKSFGKKALFAKGVAQSGGEYSHMWEKAITAARRQGFTLTPKDCLVLGVGGGTVIDVIHSQYPQAKITGIEIDPIIIQVAKEEFGLIEDKRTRIIIDDAISWVEKNSDKKFDLIIVDLYISALNPKGSRRETYLKQIKGMLKKNGVAFYNAHYVKEKSEEFDKFFTSCQNTFKKVSVVFTYPRNRILLMQ